MMKVKSKESEIVMMAAATTGMSSSAVLDLSNDDAASNAAAEERQDVMEGHEHCDAGTDAADEVSSLHAVSFIRDSKLLRLVCPKNLSK